MNKQTRYTLLIVVFACIYAIGSYLNSRAQSLPESSAVIESQNGLPAEAIFEQVIENTASSGARAGQADGLVLAGQQTDTPTSSLESVTERLQSDLSEQQQSRREEVQAQNSSSISAVQQEPLQALAQQSQAAGLLPPLPQRLEVTGPDGETVYVEVEVAPGVRTIEREWIMLVTEEQRQQLFIDAPELLPYLSDSTEFGVLNAEVLTFVIPASLDADNAVLELVPENFRTLIDRNHVYQVQSLEERAATPAGTPSVVNEQVSLLTPMSAVCNEPVSIGMIDSAIHNGHAVFRDLVPGRLQIRRFLAPELISPLGHGTAVASVLIGEDPALGPLLPNANVYSATAVHGQDRYRQGATALNLMRALGWLMEQKVSVINISLTGPENRVLKQALDLAMESGVAVVAAAGNHGAHAPPVFPAAYPGVTAVTAVDRQGGIYRWANQGEHIDYAALGVDLPVARDDGRIGSQSGTSLASPIVAAYLACEAAQSSGNIQLAQRQLQARSKDVGEPGHDSIFGYGILHPTIRN